MWLKLTTVTFIKEKNSSNRQQSLVRTSRINMNLIETYFEAPDDIRNHQSVDARANTILMTSVNGMAYHAKETVEQIDDMIGAYGCENEAPTDPVAVEALKQTPPWDNSKSEWK